MFTLVDNHHPINAYLTNPIEDSLISTSMKFFDKDGYELNKLEQLFYQANAVDISEKHLYHTANHLTWYKQQSNNDYGPILDHSLINTRWAYAGQAREQIQDNQSKYPLLSKLLTIVPKFGIDFSLDWVDNDICFELFHIELDRFDRDEIIRYKIKAESIIENTDWIAAGKILKQDYHKWQTLSSDDQSDYKAHYFGWHRAFDNRKVFQSRIEQ